ncbi:MAG: DotU family type IV/VI secretion system protein [Acidobacteriota bacterium]
MSDTRMLPMRQFEAFYRLVETQRGIVQGGWLTEPMDDDENGASAEVAALATPDPDAPVTARRLTPEAADTGPLDTGTLTIGPSARRVWQTLLRALERQATVSSRHDAFDGGILTETRYVMAALADEVFLHLPWPGARRWNDHLLEAELFGSHRAGEQIFERIDELLATEDASQIPLAHVYLSALAVGFQGRYRGRPDGTDQLASYRRRLHRMLAQREPPILEGDGRLVPQCYTVTSVSGDSTRLPYIGGWVAALVLVVVLWIAASFPLWHRLTGEIEALTRQIVVSDASTTSSP